jgi:zinc transporter
MSTLLLPLPAQKAGAPPLDRGYHFSADGTGRKIGAADAATWLDDEYCVPEEFLWLHFTDVTTMLTQWPTALAGMPPELTDILGGTRSTRIEQGHEHLIAVLNEVNYHLDRVEPFEVATLWLAVTPRCLLSVRSQKLSSVETLRREVEAGERFPGPMALLTYLLLEQADALTDIVHRATNAANGIDRCLRSGKLPARVGLSGIRRDMLQLRPLLAPEPSALFRLVSQPPHWVRDANAQALRQSAEEFSVTLRDMAGLQERVELLEEEIAARIADRTNRNVLVLTAVTVIALPTNILAALFGMNVGGVPLEHSAYGFGIIAAISLSMTALCAWLILRYHDR